MDYYAPSCHYLSDRHFSAFCENYNMSSPTEVILADPDFRESFLETIAQIKSGKVEWHKYNEVFEAYKGR